MYRRIINHRIRIPGTKSAFTLAEVLITLTIIGVIAALTIPALITGLQDAQYKTAWRKTFSDLTQATSRIMQDNGGTLIGTFQNHTDVRNKYIAYMSYIKSCTSGENEGCWHSRTGTTFNNVKNTDGSDITTANWGSNAPGFILPSGSFARVAWLDTNCSPTYCGWIVIDVNGFNGPNIVGKDLFRVWLVKNGILPDSASAQCLYQ